MKTLQILNRFYVSNMEQSIAIYQKILGETCSLRLSFPDAGLELAQIGNILILAGTNKALLSVKDTNATFVVDNINEFKTYLLANGAVIIKDLKSTPTGSNMTVKHLDGTIVEYVENE